VELEVSKFSYLSGELRYETSKHFAALKKKKSALTGGYMDKHPHVNTFLCKV
jgi:hypothetical protein